MYELQAELHLMDDHQNDGHVPRSVVWYHPEHITCRAQGVAESGEESSTLCSQVLQKETTHCARLRYLPHVRIRHVQETEYVSLPCLALPRGQASCVRIEWGTVTMYVKR